MIRPVGPAGVETGGPFAPIARPRVTARIALAAERRIALVVAPPGYGKSVALAQYLDGLCEPLVRFCALPEHATLLGFARGLAAAAAHVAPDASPTVAGAYDSAARSSNPGAELARWMHAHLRSFSGAIAFDDLHVAEGCGAISAFVAGLISRAKGRARFVIAARSFLELPIASWLAYQEMELAVDETDLAFTFEETRAAARASRVAVRDDALRALRESSSGRPESIAAALRPFDVADPADRALLASAAWLGELDAGLLEAAGRTDARARIEALRRASALLVPRHGREGLFDVHRGAAAEAAREGGCDLVALGEALEARGERGRALRAYVAAGAPCRAAALLEERGLEIYDDGWADAIAPALETLAVDGALTRPVPLALRAAFEAQKGRDDAARALLRRAERKVEDPAFRARIALRLARIAARTGESSGPVSSTGLSGRERAEAAAYDALAAARSAEPAAMEDVSSRLQRAAEEASDEGALLAAARCTLAQARIAAVHRDDRAGHVWLAQQAHVAAAKSGEASALQATLLHLLTAEARRGSERVEALERLLADLGPGDPRRAKYAAGSRALRRAWDGAFAESYALVADLWPAMSAPFDRLMIGAECAVYAAAEGQKAQSAAVVEAVLGEAAAGDAAQSVGASVRACARSLCALAEALAGRPAAAREILSRAAPDPAAACLRDGVMRAIRSIGSGSFDAEEFADVVESLRAFGLAGYGRLVTAAAARAVAGPSRGSALTQAERAVLRGLAEGRTAAQIAEETGRHVAAVQMYAQSAIEKLGCRGRTEAIAAARRMGVI